MPDSLPILIANFKANKNWQETSAYLEELSPKTAQFSGTIIVCPSHPHLASACEKLKFLKSKIILGSQDVSSFEQGPYTGEFAATQLKGICGYSIVGHSERKKYFGETTKDILEKIASLLDAQITPILCIAGDEELDFYSSNQRVRDASSKIIFVHEPPGAISNQGAYKPQDTNQAQSQSQKIKQAFAGAVVLYGGSVNPQNAKSFLSLGSVDGVLIGQASLTVEDFTAIVNN